MAKKGKGKGKGVPKHSAVAVSTNALKPPLVVDAEERSATLTGLGIDASVLANSVVTGLCDAGTTIVGRFDKKLLDLYKNCAVAVSTLDGKWQLPDMYVAGVPLPSAAPLCARVR